MRRFGRRASGTSRRYLYHDNQVFRLIGSAVVKATGLLGQLQMTQPLEKQVTIDQTEGDREEERFRAVGKGGKVIIYGQVQIRWMSEYRTSIGQRIASMARHRSPAGEMRMVILCLMALCK